MHSYTVHLPVSATSREDQLNKAVFVRDGFHIVALLVPPLWLLWHRQWLGLPLYAAIWVLFNFSTDFVSGWVLAIANFVFGLGLALEASTLRRWRLDARGWQFADAFVAADIEDAEQRFFDRLKAPEQNSASKIAPANFTTTPVITPTSTVIGYSS